jgi:hypothetical protein
MRLYSPAFHFGSRILSTGMGCLFAVAIVGAFLESKADERHIAVAVVIGMAVILAVIARLVWRTQRIFIEGEHLVIGGGARQRKLSFADVQACAYPWWVYSERFAAPLELTLRGGEIVSFFPEIGAGEIIEHRLRGARSTD